MDDGSTAAMDSLRRFDSRYTVGTIVTGTGIGLAGIGLYAACAARLPQAGVIASVGLLIAGASLAVGGLLGFLFGIPRALQHDSQPAPPSDPGSGEPAAGYRVNTNLEQISDWLTKILVGVGLTQIGTLPSLLRNTGEYLKAGLGGGTGSEAVALTVVLYFTTCGFLLGYLWTRLFLTGQFADSDPSVRAAAEAIAAQAAAAEAKERVVSLESQGKANAGAIAVAYRQLDSQDGIPQVSEQDLTAAIRAASRETRAQIFYRAADLRARTWRDQKPLMAQTIPIFRALIAADELREFHLNHGQLGFALKDQKDPDWKGAEREFTTAIDMRGDWRTQGWLYYEFNRALCRIALDESASGGRAAPPERRELILTDLRTASNDRRICDVIKADPRTLEWMKLNQVSDMEWRNQPSA